MVFTLTYNTFVIIGFIVAFKWDIAVAYFIVIMVIAFEQVPMFCIKPIMEIFTIIEEHNSSSSVAVRLEVVAFVTIEVFAFSTFTSEDEVIDNLLT